MLKDLRVCGSLIAHSERRQMFGENDQTAGMRMGNLLKNGMQAIFCVGETWEQREKGQLKSVLSCQIQTALRATGLNCPVEFIGSDDDRPLLSIAYEPVWAIGTGRSAQAQEAQAAHESIREELSHFFDEKTAKKIKILYGGSVKQDNIAQYLECDDIDGALVGGASLNSVEFAKLCMAF
jgi:triosephosphate isomerase